MAPHRQRFDADPRIAAGRFQYQRFVRLALDLALHIVLDLRQQALG